MHILRVATVYEIDVDALPNEFRSVLTESDLRAIKAGPSYFGNLDCKECPKSFQAIMRESTKSPFMLRFMASGELPYRLYYELHGPVTPMVCLPTTERLRDDVPPFLRAIYKVVGSFVENGFEYAGGLHRSDRLKPVSETGIYVTPGGSIDPSTAVPFLETLAGSQLCYLPNGKGAWLSACEFQPVDNLEKEVERYFKALLNGSRI